jgi:hypothetical protein
VGYISVGGLVHGWRRCIIALDRGLTAKYKIPTCAIERHYRKRKRIEDLTKFKGEKGEWRKV